LISRAPPSPQGIYAGEEAPAPQELIRLGEKAIRSHVSGLENTWGTCHGGSVQAGTRKARFEKVWTSLAQPSPPPEDRIIEKIALRQIWPRLTPTHQAVLLALATTVITTEPLRPWASPTGVS
jgi:hypothetical protein